MDMYMFGQDLTGEASCLQAADCAIRTGAVSWEAAPPLISGAQSDPVPEQISSARCVSAFPIDTVDVLRRGTCMSYLLETLQTEKWLNCRE